MSAKTVIGRAEQVCFTVSPDVCVPAKIDTGADSCSIWASNITKTGNELSFQLFDKDSAFYTGKTITLKNDDYKTIIVANSFGVKERRYAVYLEITVLERTLTAKFTLANRSTKIYPVLLGRSLLEQDFLVDVTKGTPLLDAEAKQRAAHIAEIEAEEQS